MHAGVEIARTIFLLHQYSHLFSIAYVAANARMGSIEIFDNKAEAANLAKIE
jgi:hypothetical protein